MRRRLCPKEALFTPSFIAVCSANLLFFIASFMMVPVLPIYLLDGLHASKSVVGIILSAYMIGALVMRPLSGFLADQFPRKILFLVCGILFAAQFEGYLLFNALALVGIVRALHGMSFGALSTSAATLAVDVIPIAKLGTGIGLYGMMGSLAMALGPMIGMLVLEAGSYDAVFITAMGCAAGGILLGLLVKKQRVTASRGEKISLDRFFLKKGTYAFIGLVLMAFVYGLLVNYLSVFARERHVMANPGYFFLLMSLGLILSRLFAGGIIDKGYIGRLILGGKGNHPAGLPALPLRAHGNRVLRLSRGLRARLRDDVALLPDPVHQPCRTHPARHGQRHLPHRVGRGHRRGRAPRRAHRGNIQLRRRVHPRPDHAVLLRRAVYEGHRPAIREKQAALRIPSSARPP